MHFNLGKGRESVSEEKRIRRSDLAEGSEKVVQGMPALNVTMH